jgi:hypothetical protein
VRKVIFGYLQGKLDKGLSVSQVDAKLHYLEQVSLAHSARRATPSFFFTEADLDSSLVSGHDSTKGEQA